MFGYSVYIKIMFPRIEIFGAVDYVSTVLDRDDSGAVVGVDLAGRLCGGVGSDRS